MTNQLDVRDFQYFLGLAEALHYKKASEKLHITQSALSQKILRLEAILGQPLFIRTNRKVNLSDAGLIFRKEAELILNQIEFSLERWKIKTSGSEGVLRIGFVASAMQNFLPTVIRAFNNKHKKIEFFLNDLNNQDQLLSLEKNLLDVGFIREKNVPNSMRVMAVHKENFALALPQNHPIKFFDLKMMQQLKKESFILFPNHKSQMYYQKILDICNYIGFQPSVTHRSIHAPTIFKLIENELGVSIVPNSLRDEKNYNIRFIELDQIPYQTELFAVWNEANQNEALTLFLKTLNKHV